LDLSIFGYQFMQNAILSAFLGGIACGTIGVFVVTMHMPFIGVCMAHAAFAGALLGLWLGFNPLLGAFGVSLAAAAIIGPLADRGELSPETSVGVNTRGDVMLLGIVAAMVVGLVFAFYKEFQATVFHRDMARSVGIPATIILYGILFLTGATITASLRSIGGLLIFSLILNPAAAAYQLTYSMKRMFLLSAGFAVLSGWIGLLMSYLFNIPSGATIVIVSSAIFGIATVLSPKRKVKLWQKKPLPEERQ
jgi:manganese/iron transport system permease protein